MEKKFLAFTVIENIDKRAEVWVGNKSEANRQSM
jgi:hypothetical protein